MRLRTIFLSIVIGLISNVLLAQTSISISQQLGYYSNSFYNYRQLPDYNDYTGLKFNHLFQGEKIQSNVYYEGDLSVFKTYTERLYHAHEFGYEGFLSTENRKKGYYFGANLSVNDYRDNYDALDFWKLELYGNMKIYLKDNLIGRFGYSLRNKDYDELPEFNYWEHSLYSQFNTYFQTGTSLTILFNYGLKNYIPLTTSQGRGRRMQVDSQELPSVDQFISNIKMAQSLGQQTSITLNYLNRLKPGLVMGSAAVIEDEAIFTEDELFDDRYGYKGHELSLEFKHTFPLKLNFTSGASRIWKNYHQREISDLEGVVTNPGIHRQDQRFIAWFELSRIFPLNIGLKNLQISLEGGYLNNESNDPYYHYNNLFGSFGFEVGIK